MFKISNGEGYRQAPAYNLNPCIITPMREVFANPTTPYRTIPSHEQQNGKILIEVGCGRNIFRNAFTPALIICYTCILFIIFNVSILHRIYKKCLICSIHDCDNLRDSFQDSNISFDRSKNLITVECFFSKVISLLSNN